MGALLWRFFSGPTAVLWYLIYSFCAFVLQLPLGVLLDSLLSGKRHSLRSQQYAPFGFALAGGVLTFIGTFSSPIILGLGNALFHVGGGVQTIREDRLHQGCGRRLGVFVASGALGLFIGRMAGKSLAFGLIWILGCGAAMAILYFWIFLLHRRQKPGSPVNGDNLENRTEKLIGDRIGDHIDDRPGIHIEDPMRDHIEDKRSLVSVRKLSAADMVILGGCFLVVILRSLVGFEVTFSWKTTVWMSLLATLAVVLGKMAGGLAASGKSRSYVILLSLSFSALGYLFSDFVPAGLLALFLFNMTMPVTLQMLVDAFPAWPGTMFGLLTVALFLGYLPHYASVSLPLSGKWIGMAGSLVSMIVLLLMDVLFRHRQLSPLQEGSRTSTRYVKGH